MEDPELLMEILEVRESLEEAQTEEEVSVIREQNKGTLRALCAESFGLSAFLPSAEHTATLAALEQSLAESQLDAPAAKSLLIRLRYQQGVEDICREWQPGKPITLQH